MLTKIRLSSAIVLALAFSGFSAAQANPPGQGPQLPHRGMPGERVMGTITSVGVDRFEIKRADGSTATVLVNDQTNYRQQQQQFQLEDLKVGDHVFVRGSLNADKQFVAAGVMRVSEEKFQRFQSGNERGPAGGAGGPAGGPGGPGGGPGGPGGWGEPGGGDRTGGDIISIDQNQIKVRNPWQGERIITVNDQTTFTKEGQTVTLKDLKVGDRIFARGKEVQGQFVATEIRSGRMGQGRGGPPPQAQ